jgi:murein L,D-transpeptidase YcbB/YkuD
MKFWLNFTVGILLLSANTAHAAESAPYLSAWLQQSSLQFGKVTIPTEALQRFYSVEGYQPVWVDADGLTPRAIQVLDFIAGANKEGLDPELYNISTIRAVAAMPRSDTETIGRIDTSLDLLLSEAVLSYATDMQIGIVPHQWDTGQPAMTSDEQLNLLRQAASASDPAAFLSTLAPTSDDYKALKTALQHYQAIAAAGGWPAFTPGKPIKSGMTDPRIAAAQQILIVNGDLAPDVSSPGVYDKTMSEGVKHFQKRHGLDADGTLNAATQAALAVPVEQRLTQIGLSLERMRWMPQSLGSRYVMINVPSFRLLAVANNQRLTMDVITGKPSTPTPMFSKNITDVVFNPTWNVPAKIAVNEMLPKLRANANYATQKGYTVIEHSGGESFPVDGASIDWRAVGRGSMTYSFRQEPGDGNALGKVKFYIPDSDNIYLHDTSQHNLFSRAERSLSHGCVRVEDPKALAEFALSGEGWDSAKIDAAYDSAVSRTVRITPLPVHLVYWTSWVDESSQVHFNRDIYGLDKKLLVAMQSPRKQNTGVKLAAN